MGSKRVLSPVADAPGPNPHGREPGERADHLGHLTVIRQPVAESTQLLVRVIGEVDLVTAPCLAAALELAPENRGMSQDVTEIVVDMGLVRFLSAAGLGELVRAHQRCRYDGVLLRVVADQWAVTIPMRLTGLDRTLGLHPDLGIFGDVPPVPVGAQVTIPERNATGAGEGSDSHQFSQAVTSL